jgi:nitroreductase
MSVLTPEPLRELVAEARLAPSVHNSSRPAGGSANGRPRDERPLLTGRHFYRIWLEIERAGLSACPMSALADHPLFNARLRELGEIGEALRLVNVFRVGRSSKSQIPRHFRLPVDQLIV